MSFDLLLCLKQNLFSSLFSTYSLDYPGVGPEHSYLKDLGRAEYFSVTDEEALEGGLVI